MSGTLDTLREDFLEQGFAFPVDILTPQEVEEYRSEMERLEARLGDMRIGYKEQLNYPHILFRFANKLVRSEKLLDAVGKILGGDIMVWSTTIFIKEPQTPSFVSWHQDLRYWGLSDAGGMLSAWLALSEVTIENGCMRFLPGSHKDGIFEHDDTHADNNALTRGQRARVDISEADTVPVCLAPGQMSLHHGQLLHSSTPNNSDKRRIGFVTVYIKPSIRQTLAPKDYAMLVRGSDDFEHFIQVPPPEEDLSEAAKQWHKRVLEVQDEVLYVGDKGPAN
ncbi:MAG: phytanoyl-CoA dioxygenase family protein [Hyphomicrobiales bacterium]|nr:phytanoyl-CoA dioxygenase family protein [Hyphomicrobiales bacterium]